MTDLSQLIKIWKRQLRHWSAEGVIVTAALEALQLKEVPETLVKLVSRWSEGNFQDLPPVVLLPASVMPGASGAYAVSTGLIYLNQDWLQNATREQALAVLTEELGHHLDGLLHSSDTPGDEGELFSALARRQPISDAQWQQAKTDDDATLLTFNKQLLLAEKSDIPFVSLPIPVGIATDNQGNLIVNNFNGQFLLNKLSPGGNLLRQATEEDLGCLSSILKSEVILQLNSTGTILSIDSNSLSSARYINLKSLSVDTSSVFDIATGTIGSMGGLIIPAAPQTSYGDISILERGEQQDIFISGLSMGVFPFILRLRFQSGSLQSSKVIVASRATTAGTVNTTRGVAVNNLGIVLTTLPIAVGNPYFPTVIDVPVSFNADFPESNWSNPPVIRYRGQGVNYIDGSNYLDVASQGMATDAAGNFYIVTNRSGSVALFSPGRATFVALSSDLSQILDVKGAQNFASYRDAAINPVSKLAYVTSSEGRIITFPASDFVLPVVSLAIGAEAEVSEDDTADLIYIFSRTGPANSALAVNFTVTGTAMPENDYTGINAAPYIKTITFAPGENIVTLSIDPTTDSEIEQDETVDVSLIAGFGYSVGTPASVSGIIVNDDTPLITLTVASVPEVTEDGTANLKYIFHRTGSATSTLTVNYTVSGTAMPETDYSGIDATTVTKAITFEPGASISLLTVDPAPDRMQEPNESISLAIAPGTDYAVGTTEAITGLILNDDLIGTSDANTLIGRAIPEFLDGLEGRDILTGGVGRDVFGFRYSHSTLTAPDRITDFQFGDDKIDLFTATGGTMTPPKAFSRAANNRTATTLAALANAVFKDANGSVGGNQPLAANHAVLVVATSPAIAGTYLFVNNAIAAQNNTNDLLINITGYRGGLPGLGNIAVNSVFV